jgi:hypothetical protein
MRGLALGWDSDLPKTFPSASQPGTAYFRELDARILAINRRGITVDLVLGGDANQLTRLFPKRSSGSATCAIWWRATRR